MPSKIVTDSSVILKWLHQKEEKYLQQAESLLRDAQIGKVELLAPELAKYEVSNVLLVAKRLTLSQGEDALNSFFSIPIHFYPLSLDLAKSTFKIGEESKITYYDASFMALAKQEKATLVTDNPKHQKKVKGVKVIPLKDYRVS